MLLLLLLLSIVFVIHTYKQGTSLWPTDTSLYRTRNKGYIYKYTYLPLMVRYGERTSFYVQKELAYLCELAALKFPDKFKSRSHVICAAVSKFLRELMPGEFQEFQNNTPDKIYISEGENALSKEEEKT